MTEYKFAVIIIGAIVVTIIDIRLGTNMKELPEWKRLVHSLACIVYGGLLFMP